MKRVVIAVLLLSTLFAFAAACGGPPDGPTTPNGPARACTVEDVVACEQALAHAIALGEDTAPIAATYASARRQKNDADPFALALDEATAAAKDGLRAAIAIAPGAKDPKLDPKVARFSIGEVAPVGKGTPIEVLYVAITEAAGLDYLAVLRADGSVVRAFGHDPLVPWMSGLVPAVVDEDARVIEHDAAIEHELREALRLAASFQYADAAEHVDALEALIAVEDPYDAQAIRARIASNALGMSAPAPIVSSLEPPPRAPEPAPKRFETAYYDLLRVRFDRASAGAYAARKGRLLEAAPQEMRPYLERTWGPAPTGCDVMLPPSFDHPRDLGFAYLLPAAILPAGARDARGRLELAAWYPRYEKLVELVERTHSMYFAAAFIVSERGGSSSITPTGSDAHKRVDALALAHAHALEDLAKKKPGRVGVHQLGFLASPAAYTDELVRQALHDLARVSAQSSMAQAKDAWDVLASAVTGLLLASNMPAEVQREHLTALAGAFKARLDGDLAKQTGWGVAVAHAADLLYRSVAGVGPNPKASATQVSRALESDPAIGQAAVASVVSALVRYAALAADGGLGTPYAGEKESVPPGRAAARASLSAALDRLDPAGRPDPRVLSKLTALADNAAAALAFGIASNTKTAAAPKEACEKGVGARDPRIARSLAKLRDDRKAVLSLESLAKGTDPWSKRARLVALILSDAIDIASAETAQAPKKKPKPAKTGAPATKASAPLTKFYVDPAESERLLKEALAAFGADADVVVAVESAYSLVRGFFTEGMPYLTGAGVPKASGLVRALAPLLTSPGQGSSAGGLLLGLASAMQAGSGKAPGFVEVARALYEKGDLQQADMILLAAVVVSAITGERVAPEAGSLAEEKKSEMAWLFDFLRFARPDATSSGGPPTTPRFATSLDALLMRKCASASTQTITGVLGAIEKFRGGKRDEGRAELDAALDKGARTLALPHVVFTFKQETTSRVLNLSVDIGLGAPFVASTGGINVGAGFKSPGEPKLEIVTDVDSIDAARTKNDTARYYVHASAVSAVYHFLSKDAEKGEKAAARALGAVIQRTWLYGPGVTDEPVSFAQSARPTLMIAAQQAIDAGRPMLAGSLLQVVRAGFDPKTASAEEIGRLLDDLPAPLRGLSDLDEVVERAKKTLALSAAGLDCVGPKLDKAVLLQPTCEAYPQAIALRLADSVAAMPVLSARTKKNTAPGCGGFVALDAFLVPAQAGKYEPDKLLDAAEHMLDDDKAFDAAFLLTRPRNANHCSERVVADLRRTATALEGVSTLRADLLTAVVNCELGVPLSMLTADLEMLDRELELVGDASRQIQIGLFAAALSVRRREPALLETVAKKPTFLVQHRKHGPLLPIALILDHVSSALSEKAIDIEGTQRDMDFLCGAKDQPAGANTCKTLRALRGEGDTAAKKKIAEDFILKLTP